MMRWILEISSFTVLGTMIWQMVPDHGFQKYVRFFMGLILLVLLAGPVLELFDKRIEFDRIYQSSTYETEVNELKEEQQKVLEDLQDTESTDVRIPEKQPDTGERETEEKEKGKKEEIKIEVERIEVGRSPD